MRAAFGVVACAFALAGGGPARADWAVARDPFDPNVVAAYRRALAANPYDAGALAKLEALYKRYRTPAALDALYAGARDHAGLVVHARLLRDRGNAAAARDAFVDAVAADPADARGWLALGDLARTAGDTRAAAVAYDQVVALAPPPALREPALRARIQLAEAARDAPALERAEDALTQLAPKDGERWLARGEAELALGLTLPAIASFEAADGALTADAPRRLSAIEELGEAMDHAGNTGGAVDEYERAIRLAPHGYYLVGELRERIVDLYRRAHELPELVDEWESAWPARARGYAEWALLGRLYLEQHHQARAIDAWRHALAASPGELATARALIAQLDDLGDADGADQIYDRSAAAAPGATDFWLELARRAFLRHRDGVGLAALHRLEPRGWYDAQLLHDVGDLYADHMRFDDAERVLERAAKLEPADPALWVALAGAYVAANDPHGAIAAWHRVAPPDGRAQTKLGELLLDAEDYPDAVDIFRAATELDATDADALRGYAWALEGAGQLDDAIVAAEQAVKLAADPTARHGARHVVIQLLERTIARDRDAGAIVWWGARDRWFDLVNQTPPDLDSAYMLIDAITAIEGADCGSDDDCATLQAAVDVVLHAAPTDPDALLARGRLEAARGEPSAAVQTFLAVRHMFASRAAEVDDALGALDRTGVSRLGVVADPDTGPRPAAPPRALRIGARLTGAAGLRGGMSSSLGAGGELAWALGERSVLRARADWSWRAGDGTAAAPSAFGASAGAGLRGEVRASSPATGPAAAGMTAPTWSRFGLAPEAELGVRLRPSGVELAVRFQEWLAGGVTGLDGAIDLTIPVW